MRGSSSVMDPQFEELASAIADAVEKRLSAAFEARIKTQSTHSSSASQAGFEERSRRSLALSRNESKRTSTSLSSALKMRMQMHCRS